MSAFQNTLPIWCFFSIYVAAVRSGNIEANILCWQKDFS